MKIKELIKQLKAYNPEEEIFLSNDPEGNELRTIEEISTYQLGKYEPILLENKEIPGQHTPGMKWIKGDNIAVIWPTDTIINEQY